MPSDTILIRLSPDQARHVMHTLDGAIDAGAIHKGEEGLTNAERAALLDAWDQISEGLSRRGKKKRRGRRSTLNDEAGFLPDPRPSTPNDE